MEAQAVIERVQTIEDAYTEKGLVRHEEIPFANPKNARQEAVNSFLDAIVLTEAYNEGWEPNWDDSEEEKYEIWWDMRSDELDVSAVGSGFSLDGVGFAYSDTFVGSRLVFKTRALARAAAERFVQVYRGFMVIKK